MEVWRESFVQSSHQPNRGCTVRAGTGKEPRVHGAAPSATTCNAKGKHFNRLANISISYSVRKMGIAEVSSGNPNHHSAKKMGTNPWSKASTGRVIAEQGCTHPIRAQSGAVLGFACASTNAAESLLQHHWHRQLLSLPSEHCPQTSAPCLVPVTARPLQWHLHRFLGCPHWRGTANLGLQTAAPAETCLKQTSQSEKPHCWSAAGLGSAHSCLMGPERLHQLQSHNHLLRDKLGTTSEPGLREYSTVSPRISTAHYIF